MTITELLLKGTTDSTLEEVNLNLLSQANQVLYGAIHGIFEANHEEKLATRKNLL